MFLSIAISGVGQITMAEKFGVAGRGAFYEETGAIRDVIQNHLLQVLAMLTMEPPIGGDPDALRDEKAKLLKSVRPLSSKDVVRGQYRGYRDGDDVAPDSQVETFAAVRLHIDSWRWADVPIVVRAGKRLPLTATEVFVRLHRPPQHVFSGSDTRTDRLPGNYFRFLLSPVVQIALGARVLTHRAEGFTEGSNIELQAVRAETTVEPYHRLLTDAMHGAALLFAREDSVEAAWKIVDPVLEKLPRVIEYEPGTWGPTDADRWVEDHGGWHRT